MDGLETVGELVGACLEAGVDLAVSREADARAAAASVIVTAVVVVAAVAGSMFAIFAIWWWMN